MTYVAMCPVCRRHPVERGIAYGIDTVVCELIPPGIWFVGNWEAMYGGLARSVWPWAIPPTPSIADRIRDLSARQAHFEIDKDGIVRALAGINGRDIGWISLDSPPGPPAVHPALGEGAVSAARHRRGWSDPACTPSSLRSPTT